MASVTSRAGLLQQILGRGYQIHPDALKLLEARGEEQALALLESFTATYPAAIVIEAQQVEALLEKRELQEAREPPGEFTATLTGRITQIYDGSGLIQRCPKCNRWILDNICMVHSDVAGIWDLRIKARFEGTNERCTVIFKRDMTQNVAQLTLEEAKKLGDVTLERIRQTLLGKRFELGGDRLRGSNNFLVKAIRAVPQEMDSAKTIRTRKM
jgi:ssDNA-binding replication factor A large subunit